jgi:hypothetical protein
LRVIAAANFDVVEIFENDLLALTAGRGMLHRAARRSSEYRHHSRQFMRSADVRFRGIWVTCGRRLARTF